MANINVRAKDNTTDRLKRLTEATGESQASVIDTALALLEEMRMCKENMEDGEKNSLPLSIKIILSRI